MKGHYICSAPFRNPKKRRLSTESAATESAPDPALSTLTYYDVTGYSVARILSRATVVLGNCVASVVLACDNLLWLGDFAATIIKPAPNCEDDCKHTRRNYTRPPMLTPIE